MRALVLCLAAVLIPGGAGCAGSPPSPAEGPASPSPTRSAVPGEYLVTIAPGAGAGVVEQVYGRFGIKKTQDLGNGVVLVSLKEDPGLARMTELQAQDPRLTAVQPNFVYRALH
jgi:hypothetical protein